MALFVVVVAAVLVWVFAGHLGASVGLLRWGGVGSGVLQWCVCLLAGGPGGGADSRICGGLR